MAQAGIAVNIAQVVAFLVGAALIGAGLVGAALFGAALVGAALDLVGGSATLIALAGVALVGMALVGIALPGSALFRRFPLDAEVEKMHSEITGLRDTTVREIYRHCAPAHHPLVSELGQL